MTAASHCRSCGAHVRWALTVKGKRIPLDLQPSSEGNIELINGVAHVVGKSDDPADVRHISHFATCIHASAHRRQQRPTKKG